MIFIVMEIVINREYILTVIVPITRMAGRLQNLKDWVNAAVGTKAKIVLVHDVQDSDTSKELNEFIDSVGSNQIIFIEKYFGSPGLSRNVGLEIVDTEWCCFWDSDDIPNVEKTIANIYNSKSGTEIIISNFKTESDQKSTVIKHYSSLDQVALNPGIWRMVFKTAAIKKEKFLDLRMGEDQIFLLDIDINYRKVEYSNDITYSYVTEQEGQLTNQANLNSLSALSVIQKAVLNSRYNSTRFLAIIYIRLFLSSLKRLKFKYPKLILIKNFCFILRLSPGSVFFFLKSLLSSRRILHKVSVVTS
ncbi:Glyco_tranf_GTA_type domain containing protein [Candidatus Nanopelagicaceae bacterium]